MGDQDWANENTVNIGMDMDIDMGFEDLLTSVEAEQESAYTEETVEDIVEYQEEQEQEDIDFPDFLGPNAPGHDFGETDATPI
jgi:hypothetical protein